METKNVLDKLLEGYQEEMCAQLKVLLQMRTVASSPTPEAPFGKEIGEALSYILKLGEEKGFKCANYEGYVGEMNFGTVLESIGVASHLDVVPEGKGWEMEPFGGKTIGGRIYGRGAVDDKGPLIAVFYACLALKESGIPLSKTVKQIIGTDEETGRFGCIKYYKDHGQVPQCGIVPDSWFPVVYAEKGFLNYRFVKNRSGEDTGEINLVTITGGEAYNVVASEAMAEFRATTLGGKAIREAFETFQKTELNADGILSYNDDSISVRFKGKAAHASVPQDGINAIATLLRFLEGVTFYPQDVCHSIHKLAKIIGHDCTGEGLDISFRDNTGELTNNIGMMSLDRASLEVKLNLRCPVTTDVNKLRLDLAKAADDAAMNFDLIEYNPYYYTELDDPTLQMLANIYSDVTGDIESKPRAHGGGSYARTLEGFIPFGPSFQNEPLMFHKQDEYITKERLLLLSKIYARAIYDLAK